MFTLDERYGFEDYPDIFDENFKKFAKSFLNQISEGNLEKIDAINIIYYLIFGEKDEQYSDKLQNIYDTNWSKLAPQFCDMFTFHSVIGVLMGQLMVPYHVNVKETKRWSYKGKSIRMFTDMFVFDECRYIYDMMPTIDMIINSLEDLDYQICYRFALDSLNKNQFLYNNEYFVGNAVIGKNHKGFENPELKNRMFIN